MAQGKAVRKFDSGMCGPDSILAGLLDIEAGKVETVTWAIAPHPNQDGKPGAEQRVDFVTVGRADIEGVLCWRFCGEGGKPDGAGSHGLTASWDRDQSVAAAACNLAYIICRRAGDRWVFRQPAPALRVAA